MVARIPAGADPWGSHRKGMPGDGREAVCHCAHRAVFGVVVALLSHHRLTWAR